MHLSDEAVHSEAYREDIPGVLTALDDLEEAFSDSLVDKAHLKEALEKMEARFTAETKKHEQNVRHLLACDFRMLNHNAIAGIGPRSCLKTIHTCSSSAVIEVWFAYSCRNSGDISSSQPVSCIAYCREIWSQHPNSPASS